MDRRLLEHYEEELRHIRHTAAEFAEDNPLIAGRLALDKTGRNLCPDPFVERLLEGFAYLSARVRLQLDAEFPRFTQGLLETVYPHYLCPVPSMTVVRFEPDLQESALAAGYTIPRGSPLRGLLAHGDRTACEFRTAQDVTLWPLRLTEARYYSRDLGELRLESHVPPATRAALRLRLDLSAAPAFRDTALGQRLDLHLPGDDDIPVRLSEQILANSTGLLIRPAGDLRNLRAHHFPASHIRQGGLRDDEALLPPSPRGFEGHRLLREYFALPQRLQFLSLHDFTPAIQDCDTSSLDLIFLFDRPDPRLETIITPRNFALFATPAINLFPKRADRAEITARHSEIHLVADRIRPLDYEIHDILSVTGHGLRTGEDRHFRPFYRSQHGDHPRHGSFFTLRRSPAAAPARSFARQTSYTGSEIFLSLVDAQCAHTPFPPEIHQLGADTLCTNRHLPSDMATGVGDTDFFMDLQAPVLSIRCLQRPTPPRPSPPEGEQTWRAISHLSLNYLSLLDQGQDGAAALRDLLRLYGDPSAPDFQQRLAGLRSASTAPVTRRLPDPHAEEITFARGLRVTLRLDENQFGGGGVFHLATVLAEFLARHASINSFVETALHTDQRAHVHTFPPRLGRRHLI